MQRSALRRLTTRAVAALACLALVAACSDDEPDDGPRVVAGMAQEWSVLGALAQVSASAAGDTVYVQAADLDAASAAAGAPRPKGADADEVRSWLLALTSGSVEQRPPVFVPFAESLNVKYAAEVEEFDRILGWSVADVSSFVEQAVPPMQFAVLAGPAGLLSPDLAEVAEGVVTDIDADDLSNNLDQRSGVSPIGRPSRLAERDGLVAMGTTTPEVQAWLAGEGETLADDEGLALVAGALDDEEVISAVVASVEPGGNPAVRALGNRATPELVERLRDEIDAMLPEAPYDAVGIGWSVDDGQPEVHVAYHFLAEAGADPGAEVLERAWRDGVSVATRAPYAEQVLVDDVDVDGPVVTVTLHLTDEGHPQVPLQMFQQREPVFLPR